MTPATSSSVALSLNSGPLFFCPVFSVFSVRYILRTLCHCRYVSAYPKDAKIYRTENTGQRGPGGAVRPGHSPSIENAARQPHPEESGTVGEPVPGLILSNTARAAPARS